MSVLFEGVVKERWDDAVAVTLIDLASDEEAYAEIELDKFPEDDREHCTPGALFTISEEPGPRTVVALRRDTWTQEELDRITAKAHERWVRFQTLID